MTIRADQVTGLKKLFTPTILNLFKSLWAQIAEIMIMVIVATVGNQFKAR